MKPWLRAVTALALALVVLSGTACVQFDQDAFNKTVVARVGNEEILMSELIKEYDNIKWAYGIDDSNENTSEVIQYAKSLKSSLLDSMIQESLLKQIGKEKGLDQYTQAEKDSAAATVDKQLADALDQYRAQFEGKDNAEELAKQALKDAMDNSSMTRDTMIEQQLFTTLQEKLRAQVVKDLTVTTDEEDKYYTEKLAYQTEAFKGGASSYEAYFATGEPLLYHLADHVFVKHILIGFSSTVSNEITNLRSQGKDTEALAKRNAELAKIKQKAQEVLDKAKKDPSNLAFTKLMEEYSTDSGSKTSGLYHDKGYLIGVASEYVTEFRTASLAMKTPGQISDLVGSDYGYHIIYLVSIPTPGPVPVGQVRADINQFLLNAKQNAAWDVQVKTWMEEYHAEKFTDKI